MNVRTLRMQTWSLLCALVLPACKPRGDKTHDADVLARDAGTSSAVPSSLAAWEGRPAMPLQAGAEYSYRGLFRGIEYVSRVKVESVVLDGETVFYFTQAQEHEVDGPDFDDMSLGMGLFAIRPDGLYTANGHTLPEGESAHERFRQHLQTIRQKDFQRILGLPLRIGEEQHIRDRSFVNLRASYTLKAVETVIVPAGTFPNCVHIEIQTTIDSMQNKAEVWIAPQVGIVRRVRASGRIDALADFKLP